MAATETIRVRVDSQLKRDAARLFAQHGTTVSQAVRGFLIEELAGQASALDEFDAIMASADSAAEASGLPEPTIDDINCYLEAVRGQRAREARFAA